MPPPRRTATQTDQRTLRFRLDGREYSVDRDEITPRLERELFTQAQITPQGAFQALAQGGATFGVAAIVWLARRQAGEMVAYDTVEEALWKASRSADGLDLELLGNNEEENDAGPPAPDAS